MQIGQLAQAMQKEPKDYMAVNMRSGKELDERRVEGRILRKRNKLRLEKNMNRTVQKL